jgi:hypothetical protein
VTYPGLVGEQEDPGRAAATPVTGCALLPGDHIAGRDEGVQVPADGGRAQAQLRAQLAGGDRAVLQQELGDPVAGTVVGTGVVSQRGGHRGVFHYTSVAYFLSKPQTAPPVIQNTRSVP